MNDKLQTYGLYESNVDNDFYFLVLDITDDNTVKGLMFYKNTLKMSCMFELDLPVSFSRIGNIYMDKNFELCLNR